MRGEREDPPISAGRFESPEDFVAVVHQQTTDDAFRARLQAATLGALDEAAVGEILAGADAGAIRYLANLTGALKITAAAPALQSIAERGVFGGHEGVIEPEAEEATLFALAGLQPEKTLWAQWYALWTRGRARLWPLATAGLRLSNPERAIMILPEAVERGIRQPEFPLGEVLWAFATDPRFTAADIASALQRFSEGTSKLCREALKAMGADDDELAAWIPAAKRAQPGPRWVQRAQPLPARPPPLTVPA
jgi:hypothetical protein